MLFYKSGHKGTISILPVVRHSVTHSRKPQARAVLVLSQVTPVAGLILDGAVRSQELDSMILVGLFQLVSFRNQKVCTEHCSGDSVRSQPV